MKPKGKPKKKPVQFFVTTDEYKAVLTASVFDGRSIAGFCRLAALTASGVKPDTARGK